MLYLFIIRPDDVQRESSVDVLKSNVKFTPGGELKYIFTFCQAGRKSNEGLVNPALYKLDFSL
ncbi:hypothetical protein A3J23_03060 [Candidatus Peregrinibacteria bacterium RIFCSPLOWO2_02_FULL_48_14]|nr:MAG: hypothetical protein A3J23_03060 [Candidatus Peregrinibacteria bacterium RIFCSPLOWO2_02_FULL_48_14]